VSEDQIGLAGGNTDLYIYVQNSPSGSVDPFGLMKNARLFFSKNRLLLCSKELFRRSVTAFEWFLSFRWLETLLLSALSQCEKELADLKKDMQVDLTASLGRLDARWGVRL
jgi:hypothetical protein